MLHRRKITLLLRTLTFQKVWNLVVLFLSYHYSRIARRSVHRGMPAKVGIEPTTSCNLRCPECISGLRAFTRPRGMLQPAHFASMVEQLKDNLVYLLLYFQGEPYLNTDFLGMARLAAKNGIYTATSTNGHYLDEERARQTVESGIHEVIISIDGTDQETYEAYRVGGNLETVKAGVKNLVEWREKLGSKTPFILLQFLVVKPNEHQIEAVQQMGNELGVDKVALKTAQIYDYEQGSDLIPTDDQYSRYREQGDGTYRIKNPLKNQCWKLWQGAEITWDGKVLPCCFDKDAEHEMGSLGDRDFREIWRDEKYEEFREEILKGRDQIEMCQNCTEGLKVWG